MPSLLPLHESEYPEELVTLNFRGLGTGYCPVLLSFASLLLLGVLALDSGGPASKLTVSGNDINLGNPVPLLTRVRTRPSVRGLSASFLCSFEPNQGQTDPQVKFLARGAGYGVFLTPDQAVLTLALAVDE